MGCRVGWPVGVVVGWLVGTDGIGVKRPAEDDGRCVGCVDGCDVGCRLGCDVGKTLGLLDTKAYGCDCAIGTKASIRYGVPS